MSGWRRRAARIVEGRDCARAAAARLLLLPRIVRHLVEGYGARRVWLIGSSMSAELVTAAVAARLGARVCEEMGHIERVVDEIAAALARLPTDPAPDLLTLHGMGGLLHDFYTGLEKIFSLVAPELNGGLPAGESWHRELLHTMTLDLPGVRPPLLSTATEEALVEHLKFRHLYRNLYGFRLRSTSALISRAALRNPRA